MGTQIEDCATNAITDTCSPYSSSQQAKKTYRIAIGSCNNQNLTQPLWDILIPRNPVAFVWAGDSIYAGRNIYPILFPP